MKVAREALEVVVVDSTGHSAAVTMVVLYMESVESNLVACKMYSVANKIVRSVYGLYL